MTASRTTVVVGGGILGLAVAERLVRENPWAGVTLLEKEGGWSRHQSGRNSGVIHSGLNYPPASAKAQWCRDGVGALLDLARTEGVPHRVTGKLVVAVEPAELPRLRALAERGRANGLRVTELGAEEAREHEPHVAALAAVHVPETGIIDYPLSAQPSCGASRARAHRCGWAPRYSGRHRAPTAWSCTPARETSRQTSWSTAPGSTPTASRCCSAITRRCGSCRSGVSTAS